MDERTAAREATRQPQTNSRRFPPDLIGRMIEAQQRERALIAAELTRIKGLMPLLMKRRNGGRWTTAERTELIHQMRALAHLSPYLAVLLLPGSFALLPVLAWWLDRRRLRRTPAHPSD